MGREFLRALWTASRNAGKAFLAESNERGLAIDE